MTNHNWLVTDDSTCSSFGNPETVEPGHYYRLSRFLTERELRRGE